MSLRKLFAGLALSLAATLAPAQVIKSTSPKTDIGFSYTAERSLQTFSGAKFWQQGGSLSAGVELWNGFGPAVDLTIAHTGSIGASKVALTTTTATFGPRYRWHANHILSPFGQVLFGIAHGSGSIFPSTAGSKPTANSFALNLDAGIDYRISRNLAVRAVDVGWVHSSLPNGADNTQNNFRVGAGVVVRF